MKQYQFSLIFILLFSSCKEFLDEKPDIKMVVPKTIEDCNLLLNDYTTMNMGYPISGELGIDDYYLDKDTWESLSKLEYQKAYVWEDELYNDAVQWQRPYKTVFLSNQILETLSKLSADKTNEVFRKTFGAAHFFRAFAFHQLIEVFAPPFLQSTANTEYGIPLRLTAGIDEPSIRSNLKESYEQIILDYNIAIANLPVNESLIGRPSKTAAYAGLSRVYLGMGEFAKAYAYADSSLSLKSTLMDFNNLNSFDELPVPQYNVEVIFPAVVSNAGPLGMSTALVDTTLYKSYKEWDLRKVIFFQRNDNPMGSYVYKGNYDNNYNSLFVGLTTSELYLIRAEAGARIGEIEQALLDLNTLLLNRWTRGKYIPSTENRADFLLNLILVERRKEMLFRGRRWADLKRLNTEVHLAKQLIRKIGDKEYKIDPNSLMYAFRIPENVIRLSKIPQNKR